MNLSNQAIKWCCSTQTFSQRMQLHLLHYISPYLFSTNTEFITRRGYLVKILCTPYENREPWRMDVCKYNGKIYIIEVETEMKREERLDETQRQKEMCYWGFSFERYMTRALSKNSMFSSVYCFKTCNWMQHLQLR